MLRNSTHQEISSMLGIGTAAVAGPGHASLAQLSPAIEGDGRQAGHVERCPACRRLFVAMRVADRVYRTWAGAPVPDEDSP